MNVLVVGNVNVETTLSVEDFPLPAAPVTYHPGRMGLAVSGVGFNVARALVTLGRSARLASVVGDDLAGRVVRLALQEAGIAGTFLHPGARTARSLVLSGPTGERQVHADLGGVADATFPPDVFDRALDGCALAVLTNVNYTRPLLERAHAAGIPVATDLHAVEHLDHPYDQDYLAAANLLFLSAERLGDPMATVRALRSRFDPEVVVVGLGSRGALVAPRGRDVTFVPAFRVERVSSTVGAGDALLAGFCHFWLAGEPPDEAARLACVFAALKLGASSGAEGFQPEEIVRRAAGRS